MGSFEELMQARRARGRSRIRGVMVDAGNVQLGVG